MDTSSPEKTVAEAATSPKFLTSTSSFDVLDGETDTYVNMSEDSDEAEGVDVIGADEDKDGLLQWFRLTTGKIVRSQVFKRATFATILINSALMGIVTLDEMQGHQAALTLMNRLINLFRALFTVELFLDFAHYQKDAIFMGWIMFDVLIILLSWTVSISFLVMRSFRLIRSLRKASKFFELNLLVKAILKVTNKMAGVVVLVILVFYTFAVIFTGLYQDVNEWNAEENYFENLSKSTLTLFQIMTLDGWSDIAKDLMEVHPWSIALVLFFIFTSTGFLFSLVIAVMGEAFTSVANERMIKGFQIDGSASPKTSRGKDLIELENQVSSLSRKVDLLIKSQGALQQSLRKAAENNQQS